MLSCGSGEEIVEFAGSIGTSAHVIEGDFRLGRLGSTPDLGDYADSSTTSIPARPLRPREASLAMAKTRNLRQAEGILRSVPDPGQIVYD